MPRVLRIAYLTGRYPAMTPTFVMGEVTELRATGVEIDTFSIWRTQPRDLLSAEDRAEAHRTTSILPPSMRALTGSLIAAWRESPLATAGVGSAGVCAGSAGCPGQAPRALVDR